ncbi:MAG: beta-propeller fold lactonase family protein [Gammaproteobacteria bacterium]|nr:beta-propeller fold lactonase family protein [Gammaproteobacteria bacterium]
MTLLVVASFSVAATPRFAYSANYFGSSISIFQVDAASGMLRHLSHVPTVKSPSTVLLHPSGSFLYAVSQVTDEIAIYRVDAGSGALREIADSPIATGVRSSFQLAVSPDGRLLYVPGRFSQNLMVFRIDQQSGALSALQDNNFPTHGDRARFINATPDGRSVYIGNTFANTIAAYRVDSEQAALTPVEGMPFKTGDAPQAIMVHPSGRYLYVANWRDGTVSAMQIDPASGALRPVPGKPVEAGIWPFAGQVHPSGRYLYVANYGSSDISGFRIDPDTGALSALPGMPAATGGEAPFTVQLDAAGRHAYAPNYNSMDVTVFDVQQASGQLVNPRLLYGRPGVRKIEILEGAAPVARSARWLLLADAERRSISSFSMHPDSGELQLRHQLPLQAAPGELALHPSGEWAFVGNPEARRIEVLRIAADGRLSQEKISIALEGSLRDLRVDARGRHLYAITQAPNQYLVFRLDMEKADIREVEKLTLPADSRPQRLAATPEERLSFVLDGSADRVFAYRYLDTDGPLSYELTRHGSPFPMARGPVDLAVDPTGRYGLAVSAEAASVTSYAMPGRWGPLKAVQGGTVQVGERPLALSISPNGRDVYVLDAGTPRIHLLQLDARDGSLRPGAPAVALVDPPAALLVDPSGRFVYIRYASRSGLTRFEVDVAQGRLIHPTEVLSEMVPSALAFSATIQ